MTIDDIREMHSAVVRAKARLDNRQSELQKMVASYLADYPVRETARRMGVSAAYVSDVRSGRRHISEAFLEKLYFVSRETSNLR